MHMVKLIRRFYYRSYYSKKRYIFICFICLLVGIFVCSHKLEMTSSTEEIYQAQHRTRFSLNDSQTLVTSKIQAAAGSNVTSDREPLINQPMDYTNQLKSADIYPNIILFWNPNDNAVFKSHDPFNTVRECGPLQCLLTTNKTYLHKAGGVVLSGYPRNLQRTKLPTMRSPLQRFVYYSPEAPDKGHTDVYDKYEFNYNYFNWTMTYRSDSSIPVPYGGFVQRNPKDKIDDGKFWALLRGKKKQVAYWVSRCNNTEDRKYRLLYAKELGKYISVDIYGECGPLKCASMFEAWKCSAMLKEDYKFYLSFENSICDEYVTEKFFGRINHLVIPIVLRGSDAKLVAPAPNSYIAADAFSDAQKLAEYLLKVDKDENLLYEHLKWYKDIKMAPTDHWCKLCHALHKDMKPSTITDLKSWIEKSVCVPGYAQKLLQGKN